MVNVLPSLSVVTAFVTELNRLTPLKSFVAGSVM